MSIHEVATGSVCTTTENKDIQIMKNQIPEVKKIVW